VEDSEAGVVFIQAEIANGRILVRAGYRRPDQIVARRNLLNKPAGTLVQFRTNFAAATKYIFDN